MNKKFTIEQFLGGVLLFAFILALCFLVLPSVDEDLNGTVIFTFLINGIFSIVMLVSSSGKYKFSLQTVHWVFYFFFFVFAPINQYISSTFPTSLTPTDQEIVFANMCLFVWAAVFYVATKSSRTSKINNTVSVQVSILIKFDKMVLLTVISVMLTIYKIITVGFFELLSRDTSGDIYTEYTSSNLLFEHVVNAIVVLCFAFACLYNKKEKHKFILFVSAICMLICCFPSGTARYNAAAVYFALLILLFTKFIKGRRFTYFFILGLVVVFPVLDAFRRSSFVDADIFGYAKEVFSDYSMYFTEGHYDAYAMFIRTVRYVSSHGFTLGYQLLGDIFFFIPRAVWTSKPIGTGAMIMTDLNEDFTNVSAPLPAEGWINFGFIGLVIFAFLLGYILSKYDAYFWRNSGDINFNSFGNSDIFYCYFISLLFFMLRGDLMSSTAYIAAYFVICFVLSHLYFGTENTHIVEKKE